MFHAVAAALVALAAFDGPPRVFSVEAGISVWDVAVEDLNLDGEGDILALCCDEKSQPLVKHVAVFLAQTDGTYAEQPSFTLPLDPLAGCAMLAEVDGSAPRELVVLNAGGAQVYTFKDNRFDKTGASEFVSLLPTGSKEPRFLSQGATDLDRDGIDEWFIPVPMGYEIRRLDGRVAHVSCDVSSEIRRSDTFSITHRIPRGMPIDMPGDTIRGLAFLSDEYADFAYGPGWKDHKRFRIPLNLEEKWEADARMADIDGNGIPDLVVTQTRGTMNIEVLTQVYLATALGEYPATPNATFTAKGAVAQPLLKDFDGDGKVDILIFQVPFGLRTITNFFLFRKVTVQVDAYRYNGNGFDDKPNLHEALTLDAPEGREQIAYTMGDFNGDGRVDVALGAGSGDLGIHIGSPDHFLSPKPAVTVSVPTFGVAQAFKLDANANEDLLIYHPGLRNKTRIEVVLF